MPIHPFDPRRERCSKIILTKMRYMIRSASRARIRGARGLAEDDYEERVRSQIPFRKTAKETFETY